MPGRKHGPAIRTMKCRWYQCAMRGSGTTLRSRSLASFAEAVRRPMLSAASRIPDCTLRKAIFVYLHACLFPHAPYPSLDMLLRHGLRPDNLLQMWSGTDRDKPNRLYRRATCNLGRGRIAITRTDGRHVRYRGKIRITLHHL